jgi:8-oxo-dGTP pyrophosphatase MutT (NUDIX family)
MNDSLSEKSMEPPSALSEFQRLRALINQQEFRHEQLRIEPERVKQAAVMLLLRDVAASAEILIIKRAEHPLDPWSGHLALPGGRADQTDENLIATAVRETFEEVGISLNAEQSVIGQLETFAPGHPQLPVIEITPLIAIAPETVSLTLSDEVAAAFWLPLQELQQSGLSETYRLERDGFTLKRPAYPSPQGPIWGITEHILTSFLKLLD